MLYIYIPDCSLFIIVLYIFFPLPDAYWIRTTVREYFLWFLRMDTNISRWQHISVVTSIVVRRKHFAGVGDIFEDGDEEGSDGGEDDMLDLQAGNSTYIASVVYAQERQEGFTVTSQRPAIFRKASFLCRQFFKAPLNDADRAELARADGGVTFRPGAGEADESGVAAADAGAEEGEFRSQKRWCSRQSIRSIRQFCRWCRLLSGGVLRGRRSWCRRWWRCRTLSGDKVDL